MRGDVIFEISQRKEGEDGQPCRRGGEGEGRQGRTGKQFTPLLSSAVTVAWRIDEYQGTGHVKVVEHACLTLMKRETSWRELGLRRRRSSRKDGPQSYSS